MSEIKEIEEIDPTTELTLAQFWDSFYEVADIYIPSLEEVRTRTNGSEFGIRTILSDLEWDSDIVVTCEYPFNTLRLNVASHLQFSKNYINFDDFKKQLPNLFSFVEKWFNSSNYTSTYNISHSSHYTSNSSYQFVSGSVECSFYLPKGVNNNVLLTICFQHEPYPKPYLSPEDIEFM